MTAETDRIKALEDAAQAVVDRWDSPLWGGSALNLKHTGEYIARLRAALAASQPAPALDVTGAATDAHQTDLGVATSPNGWMWSDGSDAEVDDDLMKKWLIAAMAGLHRGKLKKTMHKLVTHLSGGNEFVARIDVQQAQEPVAWLSEVHNKYQTRGGYDERIDVNEWRQTVMLNEPNGARYRNIRPLYAAPQPLTVQDAARVLLETVKGGLDPFDACNPEIEALAVKHAGNMGDGVIQLEIAEEFFKAALLAISEGRA